MVVTFTFGAACAITVFTSAEILLSEATGSALAGGFAAVAASGAGAAGAGAADASAAGAAGAALLLATLLEVSALPVAGLALVFAVEVWSVAEALSRLRAARRSAAAFFLADLA